MKNMTKKEAFKELAEVEKMIESMLGPELGLESNLWKKFDDMEFVDEELGTGISAQIELYEVKIMDIKSKKYLRGNYLVIGGDFKYRGDYKLYCGWVKKIA